MKKLISIIALLVLTTITITAQPMKGRYMPDLSEYTNTQNYPIERHYFYSEKEIEGENVINFGSGYYMVKVNNAPDFVIKLNNDNTKAVIVNAPIPTEYYVNETDSRITLYNKKPYYGFVYDKKYKVLYHFTSRKYFRKVDKFIKKYPIM